MNFELFLTSKVAQLHNDCGRQESLTGVRVHSSYISGLNPSSKIKNAVIHQTQGTQLRNHYDRITIYETAVLSNDPATVPNIASSNRPSIFLQSSQRNND